MYEGRRGAPHHDGKGPRQARPYRSVRAEHQLGRRFNVSIVKQRQADVGPRSSMLSWLRRRHAGAQPSTPLWRRLGRTTGPGERSEAGSRPDAASMKCPAPTSRPCQPCNDGWLHNTACGRIRQSGRPPWGRQRRSCYRGEVAPIRSGRKKTPDLSPGLSGQLSSHSTPRAASARQLEARVRRRVGAP